MTAQYRYSLSPSFQKGEEDIVSYLPVARCLACRQRALRTAEQATWVPFCCPARQPADEVLRLHVRRHGVAGGYWYGNSHLFLPAHQDLSHAA